MPATPTVRRSLRHARARLTGGESPSPPPNVRSARVERRKYGKRAIEAMLISDDDEDPPTVQEMVTGVFASQARRELKVVKKDRDDLIREVARLKQERDFLSPIVDAVKQFSLCAICYDYFRRPVLLRCGHTYCEKCFNSECVAQTTRVDPDASQTAIATALHFYYCPTCRTLTDRNILPISIHGLYDTLTQLPQE